MLQEEFYGKQITVADREMVESEVDAILHNADVDDVAFLVVGDPFGCAGQPMHSPPSWQVDSCCHSPEHGLPAGRPQGHNAHGPAAARAGPEDSSQSDPQRVRDERGGRLRAAAVPVWGGAGPLSLLTWIIKSARQHMPRRPRACDGVTAANLLQRRQSAQAAGEGGINATHSDTQLVAYV